MVLTCSLFWNDRLLSAGVGDGAHTNRVGYVVYLPPRLADCQLSNLSNQPAIVYNNTENRTLVHFKQIVALETLKHPLFANPSVLYTTSPAFCNPDCDIKVDFIYDLFTGYSGISDSSCHFSIDANHTLHRLETINYCPRSSIHRTCQTPL